MVTNKATIYRKVFDRAREYLLSFEQIDENMLDKHLNNWRERRPETVQDLLFGMLGSVCNRRGMPKTIGDIRRVRLWLEDFAPIRIIDKYGSSWEKLFKTIEDDYEPPGRMVIDNPKSYWVIFCKSVISASRFLAHFSTTGEFDLFVSQFYSNEYTRVALPLLLKGEIIGLGFPLACDFLKENGYPKFVKPDVHIKNIFCGVGISKAGSSDCEVLRDVIRFSEEINELPYCVDKLFWLVGSGNSYLDNVEIGKRGDESIGRIAKEYRHHLHIQDAF